MSFQKADVLIVKLFKTGISEKESEWLYTWLENEDHLDYFRKFVELNHFVNSQQSFDHTKSLRKAKQRIKEQQRKRRLASLFKYAASIVVLMGIGYFMVTNKPLSNTGPMVDNAVQIGTNKATLTLEDGSRIFLQRGKTYRTKNMEGTGKKLLYDESTKVADTDPAYNYLSVPRGGQFFVKLEDGTKVWLNSASKLKYPVRFVEGETREVELVYGEAYFEVSPSTMHKGATFKVISGKQEIEVLGTQFNVKAYRDETKTYTTLVEGKVKVSISNIDKILKPGEQAVLDENSKNIAIKTVNVFNEISWKDGIFSFKDTSLSEILKVLSRWYDIDIVYKDPEIKEMQFTGILDKQQNLKEILIILNKTNKIACEIKKGTLIVK